MVKDEHSNLRHLVTEERDDDKHKRRGHWTHWTSNGTFTLKTNDKASTVLYDLFIGDKYLGNYLKMSTAVQDILSGARDQELGFSGAVCGLPESVSKWNNR